MNGNALDDWFPVKKHARRGRSSVFLTYSFDREAAGAPIRSQQPYAWVDSLAHENQLRMQREDSDLVYRGDVKPHESCAPAAAANIPVPDDNPAVPPARLATPQPQAAPSAPLQTVDRASSPVTPARRIKTYAHRDKKKIEAEHAKRLAAVRAEDAVREARRAARREARQLRAAQTPSRRSTRIRYGRVGDSSTYGVFEAEQLLRAGHQLHPYINELPRPLLDRHDYVIAAVASGPKGQEIWWAGIMSAAEKAMARLYRNTIFSHLGERESHIRFGIGFGEDYAAPHRISTPGATHAEVIAILCCEAFEVISAYQNHLYEQFFPKSYAKAANQVNELVRRRIQYPAFEHSVFTTSEIDFGDGPALSRKNSDADIETMEALTVVGNWDYKERGHLIWWQDEGLVELRPGSTVIFPSGTKRWSLGAIGLHETRFVIRQYCHAGVLRWLQKGGRSDAEFEELAAPEEVVAWEATRAKRGNTKLYTKIGDIFVF